MAMIKFAFKTPPEDCKVAEDSDRTDMEMLKQQVAKICNSDNRDLGQELVPAQDLTISYVYNTMRNLCLEPSCYDAIYGILKEGIDTCLSSVAFTLDMSVGYSHLMNQIGLLQILFQHFENFVMRSMTKRHNSEIELHPEITSVRKLQIHLLKLRLNPEDIESMVNNLLAHIDRFRKGEHTDIKIAHNLALLLIDVDEYRDTFEKLLKQETSKYYSALSKRKCNGDDLEIKKYIDFVKHSLEIEDQIANRMLIPSTQYLLVETVYNDLVKGHHKTLLYKGLPELMKHKQIPYINQLYEYISKVNCLPEMYSAFNRAVYETGEQIVFTCLGKPSTYGDQEMNDAEESKLPRSSQESVANADNIADNFITELLRYREHVNEVLTAIVRVSDNAENAYAFRKEEKAAFEKICEIKPELTAENLAKAFSKLLHKNSIEKYANDKVESLAMARIELFRCIKAQDIFEAFYRQELSARLLNNLSRDDSMEKMVLEKIATECGQNYVKKIVNMFSDISQQDEVDPEEMREVKQLEFETEFKVLSTKVWPFSHEDFISIPKSIQEVQDLYTMLYKEKHPKRVLRWSYSQATCLLKTNYLNKPLDIETSQTAGLILLHFNDHEVLQKSDFPELYDATLKTLIHKKHPILLEHKGEESEGLRAKDSTTYTLNKAWNPPPLRKITIFRLNIEDRKGDVSDSSRQELIGRVQEDRKYQILAIMARVIKSFKKISHSEMLKKTIELAKTPLDDSYFRELVKSLMEKDLLIASPDDPEVYQFI